MIKCGECGYENMDGLDYCDGCGGKLGAPTPAAESAPAAAPAVEAAAPVNTTAAPETASPEAVAPEPMPVVEEVAAAAAAQAPTGEIKAPEPVAPPAVAAVSAATFKAKLTIIRGTVPERRNHEFELEAGNNLVGRWDPETGSFPEVDLDADDPEAKISRKHALIRLESGKITVEDIGSLNGTYVNRQPRLQPGSPAELKDGDEVIIGKTFLKLTVSPIS